MSIYDELILGGTLVGAVCGVILVLQAMGLDIRLWSKSTVGIAMPTEPPRPRLKYWLMLALFVLNLIGTAVVGYRASHPPTPAITADNVEEFVKSWCEGTNFSVREVPTSDTAPFYFGLDIALANGIHVSVVRPKQYPNQLAFSSMFVLNPLQKSELEKLSPKQLDIITA